MHAALIELVESLPPADGTGERLRAEALARLRATDDVYRRVKPATPSPHLVVSFLPVDCAAGRVARPGRFEPHLLRALDALAFRPRAPRARRQEDPSTTAGRTTFSRKESAISSC